MPTSQLILVLGDQLSLDNPALASASPGTDVVVMAEVHEETHYVPHNRHKIAFILSAMRHFRAQLTARGFQVIYYTLADQVASLDSALQLAMAQTGPLPVGVRAGRTAPGRMLWPTSRPGCSTAWCPCTSISGCWTRCGCAGR